MSIKKAGVRYHEFTSFLISCLIYLAVIGILLFKASQVDKILQKYSDDKDAFMDIFVMDIDDSLIPKSPEFNQKDTKTKNTPEVKPQEKEEIKTTVKQVEPPDSSHSLDASKKENKKPEPEPVADIKKEDIKPKEESKNERFSDLFASVTKDNKKLENSSNKDNLVQSSKKSAKETKSVKQTTGTAQKAIEKGPASGKSSMSGIYDEFRGGVEKQLRILWSKYNALDGNDATVRITIGPDGLVLEYKILELSYNFEFNQKVRDFESVVRNSSFPKPPNGRSFTHDYKLQDLIQ